MINFKTSHSNKYFWLYDPDCISEVTCEHFSPEFWEAKQAINKTEIGRGTTLFITHKQHQLVLRHYLRGGMMSKICRDHYLFTGLEKTRSFSELNVLKKLQSLNLPAPRPAAAQFKRKGLYYQADILIHQIPGARDLLNILESEQDQDFYTKLGKQIAEFHKHGLYHADLNIKNILRDESGQFWLIDFDRAEFRKPLLTWQQANLSRLKRSFEKEVGRHDIKWTEQDWQFLCEGYREAL